MRRDPPGRQLAGARFAASIRAMHSKPIVLAALLLAGCASRAPAPVVEPATPATPVAPAITSHATADHTCVLDDHSAITCWGRNDHGQLGSADTATHRMTIEHEPRFEMVAVGGSHTCALDADGLILCWGANAAGQLGDGDTTAHAAPATVASERRFSRVSAGERHTCALDDAGRAFCWGDNRWGQLGDGSRTQALTPGAVRTRARFTALAAGARHTCGLTMDGRVLCWGDNFLRQLGLPGPASGSAVPVEVPLTDSAVAVSTGHGHSCALTAEGAAWCWGQNGIGQLGSGAPPGASGPVRVINAPALAAIRVGYHHTCAFDVGGDAWCWGANDPSEPGDAAISGQLGAPVSWTNLPVHLERIGDPLLGLAPGDGHTCVLAASRVVYCFGSNRFGQLGRAQPASSLDPVEVLRLTTPDSMPDSTTGHPAPDPSTHLPFPQY